MSPGYWILAAIFIGLLLFVYGLGRSQAEDKWKLEAEKARSEAVEREQKVKEFINKRDEVFKTSFCGGRKWLADMIGESSKSLDDELAKYLTIKPHPAVKAADAVKQVKAERRQALAQLKFLEYQLRSYEEYFPFLEEYRDAILDELNPFGADKDNVTELEQTDPVIRFLSKEEYDQLTPAEKHQRSLERYIERPKTPFAAGVMYERYLGYLFEVRGWRVSYEGAIKGYEDFGRDLICHKGDTIRIVQAKRWRSERIVREKHIFQLYGTTCFYKRKHQDMRVQAQFCTTTEYSEEARYVADDLKIDLRKEPFDINYPMIKCNINPTTKEKIYHLPFDQQYDRTVIGAVPGESYVKTAQEAEEMGFRRAWRYRGPM